MPLVWDRHAIGKPRRMMRLTLNNLNFTISSVKVNYLGKQWVKKGLTIGIERVSKGLTTCNVVSNKG